MQGKAGQSKNVNIKLQSLEEIPGALQMNWSMTEEREGGDKPCCVAEWLLRYYE